jgi:hypothetical protein
LGWAKMRSLERADSWCNDLSFPSVLAISYHFFGSEVEGFVCII